MADNPPNPDRSAGAAYAASVDQDKEHRDKARSLRPLRYLWPYVARYPGWLIGFLVFLTLSAAATLSMPAVLRITVDCGFGNGENLSQMCERVQIGQGDDLSTYFKLAFVFAFLFAVFGSLRYFFITTLGQRVIADIRSSVYDHLLTLSPSYFERVRTGEVLSRLTTDSAFAPRRASRRSWTTRTSRRLPSP